MNMYVRLLLLMTLVLASFSAVHARSVKICFNTLTVYESQADHGRREEWHLEFYVVKPYGELRLGKTVRRVPEKLSGEWSTKLKKCYTTNIEESDEAVTVKVSGYEKDFWKKEMLPSSSKVIYVDDGSELFARDFDRAYAIDVNIRD